VQHWKIYAVIALSEMGFLVSIAALLSFWKPIVITLEKWLISAGRGTGEIVCPMCGQSVSGATGSSSIATVDSRK
jgi:hypothetical protein